MKKHFFLKIAIPAIAIIMLANTLFGLTKNPKRKTTEPKNPVAQTSYKSEVAGIGVVEPQSEIIKIGTNISGIVTQIYVNVGDKIFKNDSLFTVDDREAKANLHLKKAQIVSAKIDAAQKRSEFEMYRSIPDKRAYSKDEFNKKKSAYEIAEQKVKEAQAEIALSEVIIEKSTTKSPIDGEILKLDIRTGEYAQSGVLVTPLMLIGDLSKLHLRVEIDESQISKISSQNKAVGYLRGNPKVKVPLTFIRIEPNVVPKVSISGTNDQKIDSRVLQVIYSFENDENNKIFVGQQMDVYIEAVNKNEELESQKQEVK